MGEGDVGPKLDRGWFWPSPFEAGGANGRRRGVEAKLLILLELSLLNSVHAGTVADSNNVLDRELTKRRYYYVPRSYLSLSVRL